MRDERRQGYKHINIRNCNTPILRQDKTREQKVSKDKKKNSRMKWDLWIYIEYCTLIIKNILLK